MIPHLMIVCAGILAVWRPVETHPVTGVVLTLALLALLPWAWERTSATGVRRFAGWLAPWLVFLAIGQAGGWDRSEAIGQVFLFAGVIVAMWLASRHRPEQWMIDALAVALIGLALWGLWQSLVGLDQLRVLADSLPEHLRVGAVTRIDRGRAFASLLLPSHLAVVLATVLPIVMVRIDRGIRGLGFGLAFAIGVAGLVATRSPVGVALAVGSCAMVGGASRKKYLGWIIGAGLAAVTVVVAFRPDVLRLDPITLRLDNWGSALWVWSTAPVVGVGLGGFGQVAQAVPWPVGNHPVHAHSLPLEMLADLGLLGLVAWGLSAVWLLWIVRRLWSERPEIAIALLVIPIHNLVDFSVYTSAVALPWAILMGWSIALTKSEGEGEGAVSPAWRWAPILGGACAVALALLGMTGFFLKEAAQGEAPLKERSEWAGRAAALVPWDGEAAVLAGELGLEIGEPAAAQEAFSMLEARVWQRPRSAARAQLLARLATLAGDPVGGISNLWRAQKNQPYDGRRREDFVTMVEQLEGQSHGSH